MQSHRSSPITLSSELNTKLASLEQDPNYVEPDLDEAFSPPGTLAQQVNQQQRTEILQIFDGAVNMYENILITGDVELSSRQLPDIVKSFSTMNTPANPLPETMSSMFGIVDVLGERLSKLDVYSNDPQSVFRAQYLLQGVANIISNSIVSSFDALTHEEITDGMFKSAVFDVALTEEEENKYLTELRRREAMISEVQRKSLTSVLNAASAITGMLSRTAAGSASIITPTFSAAVASVSADDFDSQTFAVHLVGGSSLEISILSIGETTGESLVVKILLFHKALFGVAKDADIDGAVVYFGLSTRESNEPVANVTFAMTQTLQPYDKMAWNCSEEIIVDEETDMAYLSADVTNHSTYSIVVEPEPERRTDTRITVYVIVDCVNIIECRPTPSNYSYKRHLPVWNRTDPWQASFDDLSGVIYVGIQVTDLKGVGKPSSKFCFKHGGSRCRTFDVKNRIWKEAGTSVIEQSTLGSPSCMTTAPSGHAIVSSGFKIPTINPIDFKRIFDHFADLLGDNPAVFAAVVIIVVIYLLVAIWARRADRKDIEKWSVLPLIDNNPNYRYFYKVTVFTGIRRLAGTKSNIYVIISGQARDTDVRALKDARNREFSTGSIRHFTLATQDSLGDLIYLRIWHDNSGKGNHASWFLDKIIVEDLQTKQRYFFLCGRWLAVDEDDGLIDRILPVAGRDDVIQFERLFYEKARSKLFDDHLWLSVVGRPSRSNFTRLQRLTCILCLLFTTMVANAMWYGRVPVESDRVLTVGSIELSAGTLLVSVFGALTVVPINTAIVLLFRKHRPREWLADDVVLGARGQEIAVRRLGGAAKTKWWKQKYPLPHWCAYLAWTLAILCSLTGMLFVILYSLQWGKEKANRWLSSLLISTVQSVLVIQPIKVILLAALLALITKTLDDDDNDVVNRLNNASVGRDEEFMDEDLRKLNELVKPRAVEPLDSKALAKIRKKRRHEKRMWTLIKDSTLYFFFLVLIFFIAWSGRSPILYHSNQAILAQMAGGDVEGFLSNMIDGHHFWRWSRGVLVENLFYMEHYNGEPATLRDRQYLSDGINFRVGPLTMRQVRVKPGYCRVLPTIRRLIKSCSTRYSFLHEEDRDFLPKWRLDEGRNGTDDQELNRTEQAFRYRRFTELKTIPFWGLAATYGGGGYVANLGSSRGQASAVVDDLLDDNWIDYYTRAVFVQFAVYSPNINTFAYVTYALEWPGTGAVIASARAATFVLFTNLSGMTAVVVGCQILYMLLIVVFMVREAIRFRQLGRRYWTDAWNYVEVMVICLSWAAFAIYLMKEIVGRLILGMLIKNNEQFINFALFAYYDEIQWYVVGVIVFLCNLKFLRLLHFNKHIKHFSETLSRSCNDLAYFTLSFSIVFVAFMSMVYLLFMENEEAFSSVVSTMQSLFSMLIGKFDIGSALLVNRVIGPLIFGLYAVLLYFIAINMFLAIIGDAYAEVSANPQLIGNDYNVVDFIAEKALSYMGIRKYQPHQDNDVRYLNSLEALNVHLDTLDQLITNECRVVLNLEREAMTSGSGDEKKRIEENMKSVMKIAFLSKLQKQCITSSSPVQ